MFKNRAQFIFALMGLVVGSGAYAEVTPVWNCSNGAMQIERITEPYNATIMRTSYQVVIRNYEANGGAGVIRYFESEGFRGDLRNENGDLIFKGLMDTSYHSSTSYERTTPNQQVEIRRTSTDEIVLILSNYNRDQGALSITGRANWDFRGCRRLIE